MDKYFSEHRSSGDTLYVWISGKPKALFYTASVLFMPVITLVDSLGYLSGHIKIGEKATWNDELLRIAHDTRKVEIGVGLINIAYTCFSIVWFLLGVSFFVPSFVLHCVLGIFATLVATYTAFVFQWSITHEVDPINGTRRILTTVE